MTSTNIQCTPLYIVIQQKYNDAFKTFKGGDMGAVSNIYLLQEVYLDLIKSDYMEIMGIQFKFSDDIWDFSSLAKDGRDPRGLYYSFTGNDVILSSSHKDLLKLFIMYLIYQYGMYRSNNKHNFRVARSFLNYLQNTLNKDLFSVKKEDVAKFLVINNPQYNTEIKNKQSLKAFFEFTSLISKNIMTADMLQYLNDCDRTMVKSINEQNKTKLLPSDFVKEYSELLKSIVYDSTFTIIERSYAGLLYVGTQTGLRASELCLLAVDSLNVVKHRDKVIGILNYKSTKNGGTRNNIYTPGSTNASEAVVNVIKFLIDLLQTQRRGSEYLVPYIKISQLETEQTPTVLPASRLAEFQKQICVQYRERLNLLNRPNAEDFESVVNCTNDDRDLAMRYGLTGNDYVCCPTMTQFRVYFASELHERGVDYKTISYLLNHKTEEMWGYYVRPKHDVQEDIDFSKEVVGEIIRDETKILGPKGDAIKIKIDEMIKENNFNIVKDFNAIVDMVCNQMPIRAKEGGFCIKSNPRRECRHDAPTDEFLCAYGCCPNHCHFYFHAHISYQKCVDIKKCFDYNKEQGFVNQSQKELYKLEAIMNQELIPELNELEVQLNKRSVDDIISVHPDITNIIHNLKEIKEEIEIWKTEISQMKKLTE